MTTPEGAPEETPATPKGVSLPDHVVVQAGARRRPLARKVPHFSVTMPGARHRLLCGPYAVAVVTGEEAPTALRIVRKGRRIADVNGYAGKPERNIYGIYPEELVAGLEVEGFKVTKLPFERDDKGRGPLLVDWHKEVGHMVNGPVIVGVVGHFVTYQNGKLVDNQTARWMTMSERSQWAGHDWTANYPRRRIDHLFHVAK